jgi:hypothetical protein
MFMSTYFFISLIIINLGYIIFIYDYLFTYVLTILFIFTLI